MEMEGMNKTREQWYDELFDGACVSNSRARVERRLAIIDAIADQATVKALEFAKVKIKVIGSTDWRTIPETLKYLDAEIKRLTKDK
jgi:archaellum component FlaC